MRISHRYNFIFFCNPKTGSESVRKMLTPFSDICSTVYLKRTAENPFYSHITPMETRTIFSNIGWNYDKYRKFVFVRNPWARLVSLYEMIIQNQPVTDYKPGFTEWLHTIKPYGTGGGGEDWKRWRKYGTYSLDRYAGDEAGNLLVDKVIRLEDINTDLIPYLESLGIPDVSNLRLQHVNIRKKPLHYRKYYIKETRKLVESMYDYDIRCFNYKFEE